MLKHLVTDPTPVFLHCILMPNGELISQGKTVGWWNESKKYIFPIGQQAECMYGHVLCPHGHPPGKE